MRLPLLALACLLGGCAAVAPQPPVPVPEAPPAPAVTNLAPYFVTLDELADAETTRQAALLAELQSQLAAGPGARNTLRYALALGSAGHDGSDPVEARRLLDGLLAAPGELQPAELQMLNAFEREFEARVTLYARLARQREEFVSRMAADDEVHARALQAAASETARLRRELKKAEVKLQAITEMERELLEQVEQDGQTDQPEQDGQTDQGEQDGSAPPR